MQRANIDAHCTDKICHIERRAENQIPTVCLMFHTTSLHSYTLHSIMKLIYRGENSKKLPIRSTKE